MKRNSIDAKEKRYRPSGAAVMRPELTESLFRALFEEWAETGYTGISLERVAKRAGAGKTAIYRRWPSKLVFASEAIELVGSVLTELPDTKSLRADIKGYLTLLRRTLKHSLVQRILPDLIAERARSGELSEVFKKLSVYRRKIGRQILERAISRGELNPKIDQEMALDLIPSPMYWRFIVSGKSIKVADVDKFTDVITAGLKVL